MRAPAEQGRHLLLLLLIVPFQALVSVAFSTVPLFSRSLTEIRSNRSDSGEDTDVFSQRRTGSPQGFPTRSL